MEVKLETKIHDPSSLDDEAFKLKKSLISQNPKLAKELENDPEIKINQFSMKVIDSG